MNELTELDFAKARRVLDAAAAPAFSLADAIKAARDRFQHGASEHVAPVDVAVRPADYESRKRWDALQAARARIAAHDAEPQRPATAPAAPSPEQMSDDEIRARIAELRARGAK